MSIMIDIPYWGFVKLRDTLVKYKSNDHKQMAKAPEEQDTSPYIIFLHGAGATHKSFAYIQSQLEPTKFIHLEYDIEEGFWNNLETMVSIVEDLDNCFIVAHSLGGIYAIHLQHLLPENISGVVSLATPFHGSKIARYMNWIFPKKCLFREISPNSQPIKSTYNMKITVPWLQIISTSGGVPWHLGENDSVVTIDSMMDRNDVDFEKVNSCHYEILVDPKVISLIRNRIGQIKKT